MCSIEDRMLFLANDPKSRIVRRYSETSGRHRHFQYDEPRGPATKSANSVLILMVDLE